MSTANQKAKAEAAHTATVLREAATRLLQWADLLTADSFPSSLPPEEVRAVAHALAKQGGRLEMALEMARPKSGRTTNSKV